MVDTDNYLEFGPDSYRDCRFRTAPLSWGRDL